MTPYVHLTPVELCAASLPPPLVLRHVHQPQVQHSGPHEEEGVPQHFSPAAARYVLDVLSSAYLALEFSLVYTGGLTGGLED